jgi:aminoglycoside phosphotransferase (APT) family kinase protein
MIGVEKTEMHRGRQHLADRRFAGAHEADEGDVLNRARWIHWLQLNDPCHGRTPFLQGW